MHQRGRTVVSAAASAFTQPKNYPLASCIKQTMTNTPGGFGRSAPFLKLQTFFQIMEEPDFETILKSMRAQYGDTESAICFAAEEYAIQYYAFYRLKWVELNQVIGADCENLPPIGEQVLVEHKGVRRLDTLIEVKVGRRLGVAKVWSSNTAFVPNGRAERWCFIPSPTWNSPKPRKVSVS